MNSLFSNANTLMLNEVESTNNYLKKLAAEKILPEGFSVLTGYQTSGRGQYGNGWESERGQNLLFSYFLRPTFLNAQQVFYLSMSVCLAIHEVVSLYADNFKIKWPNDIIRAGKKYSGVLIENQLSGSYIQNSIVGVGLNVNQAKFNNSQAASLGALKGFTLSGDEILKTLQNQLEIRYNQLQGKNFSAIKQEYLQLLYGYKKEVSLLENKQDFKAQVLDVDEQGYLHVQKKNGDKKRYAFKEVQFAL